LIILERGQRPRTILPSVVKSYERACPLAAGSVLTAPVIDAVAWMSPSIWLCV